MANDNDWDIVGLENIAGGAAVERFEDGLQEVIENMLDPNVDQSVIREVRMVLKLKPDKNDPEKVNYSLDVKTKLSHPKGVSSLMYIGKENGKPVAKESNIEQETLFEDKENLKTLRSVQNND